MIPVDKDLEVLRQEYGQLSSRISRSAILGLSAAILLIIPFSRACTQLSGSQTQQDVNEIYNLSKYSAEETGNLSYIFSLYPNGPGLAAGLVPQVALPQEPALTPDLDVILGVEGAAEAFEKKKQEHDQVIEQYRAKQRALIAKLEGQAKSQFTVKPSILGSDLEIDLRYWIFFLPCLVWVLGSYLYISRKKLFLISDIAAYRVSTSDDSQISTLDVLYFSDGSNRLPAFAKYPEKFESSIYVLSVLLLIAYLIITSSHVWRYWSSGALLSIIEGLSIITFYVVAYCVYVAAVLEAQAREFIGVSPTPNKCFLIWEHASQLVRAFLSVIFRKRSKLSLSTGSMLVLATLFLSTATSCSTGEPRTGVELALGKNDAIWVTAAGLHTSMAGAAICRIVYICSLLLAVSSLVFVIYSYFRTDKTRTARLTSWLWRISGAISLFILSELFFINLIGLLVFADILRLVVWVFPVLLWYFFAFSKQAKRRSQWLKIRTTILLLYAPGVVVICHALFKTARAGIWGLPIYFLGVSLISLGYMQLFLKHKVADDSGH